MAEYQILESFESVYKFSEKIRKRELNDMWKDGRIESSKEFEDLSSRKKWYHTSSYQEAEELLEKGWDAGAKELEGLAKGMQLPKETIVKNVKGFFASVPDALTGRPKSMYDKKKKEQFTNTVNIVVSNVAADKYTDKIIKIGAIAIDIVNAIESTGVRCNLYSCPQMSADGWSDTPDIVGCIVKLKDAQQPLNLKKIAYPLGHISWFRRQGFRYLETAPQCKTPHHNYGHSAWEDKVAGERQKVIDAITSYLGNTLFITFKECEKGNWDSQEVFENLKVNELIRR